MSRFKSWLVELPPEMFLEISYELAAETGIAATLGRCQLQTGRS